jgi:hypothetical protein
MNDNKDFSEPSSTTPQVTETSVPTPSLDAFNPVNQSNSILPDVQPESNTLLGKAEAVQQASQQAASSTGIDATVKRMYQQVDQFLASQGIDPSALTVDEKADVFRSMNDKETALKLASAKKEINARLKSDLKVLERTRSRFGDEKIKDTAVVAGGVANKAVHSVYATADFLTRLGTANLGDDNIFVAIAKNNPLLNADEFATRIGEVLTGKYSNDNNPLAKKDFKMGKGLDPVVEAVTGHNPVDVFKSIDQVLYQNSSPIHQEAMDAGAVSLQKIDAGAKQRKEIYARLSGLDPDNLKDKAKLEVMDYMYSFVEAIKANLDNPEFLATQSALTLGDLAGGGLVGKATKPIGALYASKHLLPKIKESEEMAKYFRPFIEKYKDDIYPLFLKSAETMAEKGAKIDFNIYNLLGNLPRERQLEIIRDYREIQKHLGHNPVQKKLDDRKRVIAEQAAATAKAEQQAANVGSLVGLSASSAYSNANEAVEELMKLPMSTFLESDYAKALSEQNPDATPEELLQIAAEQVRETTYNLVFASSLLSNYFTGAANVVGKAVGGKGVKLPEGTGAVFKEPFQEAIEGTTEQLSKNYALQTHGDENKELFEGAGTNAGASAIAAFGFTGGIAAVVGVPKALETGANIAKSAVGMFVTKSATDKDTDQAKNIRNVVANNSFDPESLNKDKNKKPIPGEAPPQEPVQKTPKEIRKEQLQRAIEKRDVSELTTSEHVKPEEVVRTVAKIVRDPKATVEEKYNVIHQLTAYGSALSLVSMSYKNKLKELKENKDPSKQKQLREELKGLKAINDSVNAVKAHIYKVVTDGKKTFSKDELKEAIVSSITRNTKSKAESKNAVVRLMAAVANNDIELTEEDITRIANDPNNNLTREDLMKAISYAKIKDVNELVGKTAGSVRDNILNGNANFVGLRQYNDTIIGALALNDQYALTNAVNQFNKFKESHNKKAEGAKKILSILDRARKLALERGANPQQNIALKVSEVSPELQQKLDAAIQEHLSDGFRSEGRTVTGYNSVFSEEQRNTLNNIIEEANILNKFEQRTNKMIDEYLNKPKDTQQTQDKAPETQSETTTQTEAKDTKKETKAPEKAPESTKQESKPTDTKATEEASDKPKETVSNLTKLGDEELDAIPNNATKHIENVSGSLESNQQKLNSTQKAIKENQRELDAISKKVDSLSKSAKPSKKATKALIEAKKAHKEIVLETKELRESAQRLKRTIKQNKRKLKEAKEQYIKNEQVKQNAKDLGIDVDAMRQDIDEALKDTNDTDGSKMTARIMYTLAKGLDKYVAKIKELKDKGNYSMAELMDLEHKLNKFVHNLFVGTNGVFTKIAELNIPEEVKKAVSSKLAKDVFDLVSFHHAALKPSKNSHKLLINKLRKAGIDLNNITYEKDDQIFFTDEVKEVFREQLYGKDGDFTRNDKVLLSQLATFMHKFQKSFNELTDSAGASKFTLKNPIAEFLFDQNFSESKRGEFSIAMAIASFNYIATQGRTTLYKDKLTRIGILDATQETYDLLRAIDPAFSKRADKIFSEVGVPMEDVADSIYQATMDILGLKPDNNVATLALIEGLKKSIGRSAINVMTGMTYPHRDSQGNVTQVPLVSKDQVDMRVFNPTWYSKPTDNKELNKILKAFKDNSVLISTVDRLYHIAKKVGKVNKNILKSLSLQEQANIIRAVQPGSKVKATKESLNKAINSLTAREMQQIFSVLSLLGKNPQIVKTYLNEYIAPFRDPHTDARVYPHKHTRTFINFAGFEQTVDDVTRVDLIEPLDNIAEAHKSAKKTLSTLVSNDPDGSLLDEDKAPRTEPLDDSQLPTNKLRSNSKVSAKERKVLSVLNKQAYVVRDYMSHMLDVLGRGFFYAVEGVKVGEELVEVPASEIDAHKANAQRLSRVLDVYDEMRSTFDEEGNPTNWYFTHSVTSFGRYQMNQQPFNPQTDKLARHLVRHNMWRQKLTLRRRRKDGSNALIESKAIQRFLIGVAQSLGVKTDQEEYEVIRDELNQLVNNSSVKDALESLRAINNAQPGSLTDEEIQQHNNNIAAVTTSKEKTFTLEGLYNYMVFQDAVNSGAKSVEVDMSREDDGRTNGSALSQLYYTTEHLLDEDGGVNPYIAKEYNRFGIFFKGQLFDNYVQYRKGKPSPAKITSVRELTEDEKKEAGLGVRGEDKYEGTAREAFNILNNLLKYGVMAAKLVKNASGLFTLDEEIPSKAKDELDTRLDELMGSKRPLIKYDNGLILGIVSLFGDLVTGEGKDTEVTPNGRKISKNPTVQGSYAAGLTAMQRSAVSTAIEKAVGALLSDDKSDALVALENYVKENQLGELFVKDEENYKKLVELLRETGVSNDLLNYRNPTLDLTLNLDLKIPVKYYRYDKRKDGYVSYDTTITLGGAIKGIMGAAIAGGVKGSNASIETGATAVKDMTITAALTYKALFDAAYNEAIEKKRKLFGNASKAYKKLFALTQQEEQEIYDKIGIPPEFLTPMADKEGHGVSYARISKQDSSANPDNNLSFATQALRNTADVTNEYVLDENGEIVTRPRSLTNKGKGYDESMDTANMTLEEPGVAGLPASIISRDASILGNAVLSADKKGLGFLPLHDANIAGTGIIHRITKGFNRAMFSDAIKSHPAAQIFLLNLRNFYLLTEAISENPSMDITPLLFDSHNRLATMPESIKKVDKNPIKEFDSLALFIQETAHNLLEKDIEKNPELNAEEMRSNMAVAFSAIDTQDVSAYRELATKHPEVIKYINRAYLIMAKHELQVNKELVEKMDNITKEALSIINTMGNYYNEEGLYNATARDAKTTSKGGKKVPRVLDKYEDRAATEQETNKDIENKPAQVLPEDKPTASGVYASLLQAENAQEALEHLAELRKLWANATDGRINKVVTAFFKALSRDRADIKELLTNTKIVFGTTPHGANASVSFNNGVATITINDKLQNPEIVAEALSHEITHVIIENALNKAMSDKATPEEEALVNELHELMNTAQAAADASGFRYSNHFDNLHEFVTWAMTSPTFQNFLDGIPHKHDNALIKGVKNIKNALPTQLRSLLDKLFGVFNKLIGLGTNGSALRSVLKIGATLAVNQDLEQSTDSVVRNQETIDGIVFDRSIQITRMNSEQVFDSLAYIDNRAVTQEHSTHLKTVLRNITNKILEPTQISVSTTNVGANGYYLTNAQKVELFMHDDNSPNEQLGMVVAPFNMSMQENYVYNLTRLSLHTALSNKPDLYKQADKIYGEIMEELTPQDFLDVSNGVGLDEANRMLNVLRNISITSETETHDDLTKLDYTTVDSRFLADFMALATTNETMRNAIDKAQARINERAKQPKPWKERIIDFVLKALDFLYGVYSGNLRINQIKDSASIDNLVTALARTEVTNKYSLEKAAQTSIGMLVTATQVGIDVVTKVAKSTGRLVGNPREGSKLDTVVKGVRGAADLVTSGQAVPMVNKLLDQMLGDSFNKKPGILNSILDEFAKPSRSVAKIQALLRLSNRTIETKRKNVADSIHKIVKSSFLTPLTKGHEIALNLLTKIDAHQLTKVHGEQTVIDWITNPATRANSKQQAITDIGNILTPSLANYVINSALNLGQFLNTNLNRSSKPIHFNALKIVESIDNIFSSAEIAAMKQDPAMAQQLRTIQAEIAVFKRRVASDPNTLQDLVKHVDTLVSIETLNTAREVDLQNLADIVNKEYTADSQENGITAFMGVSNTVANKQGEYRFGGNPHPIVRFTDMPKGFHKKIYTPYKSHKLVVLKVGETIDEYINDNNIKAVESAQEIQLPDYLANKGNKAYLINIADGGLPTFQAGVLSTADTTAKQVFTQEGIGTDLRAMEGVNLQDVANTLPDTMDLFNQVGLPTNKVNLIRDPVTNKVHIPIPANVLSEARDAVESGIRMLSVTGGDVVNVQGTKEVNEKAIDAMLEEYDSEYLDHPEDFVFVSNMHTDPEIREFWNTLPEQTKDYMRSKGHIFQYQGRDVEGLFVPKAVLYTMFGQRKLHPKNLYDLPIEDQKLIIQMIRKMIGGMTKLYNAFNKNSEPLDELMLATKGFTALTELTSYIKSTVVVRFMNVMIVNVLSNTAHLIFVKNIPIARAIKYQVDGYIHGYDYLLKERKMRELMLKHDAVRDPAEKQKLRNEIKRMQVSMSKSPVHHLIERGLLQTIIEDVEQADETNDYNQGIDHWISSKIDEKLTKENSRKFAHELLMTQRSTSYNVLHHFVQLGDFASRYALITESTRKGQDLNEAIQEAVFEFIDYDRPTHKLIMLANDTGLLWFTRYAFRIQAVLLNNLLRDPARVIMFLLLQEGVDVDAPDPYDSSVLHGGVFNTVGGVDRYINGLTTHPALWAF